MFFFGINEDLGGYRMGDIVKKSLGGFWPQIGNFVVGGCKSKIYLCAGTNENYEDCLFLVEFFGVWERLFIS